MRSLQKIKWMRMLIFAGISHQNYKSSLDL